ncbi:Sodium / potassium ATPase beta chain [Homalodisca vitripennis]|nr:Sodium / potassium ATPase beta chain [Homalodisca vitripennis]
MDRPARNPDLTSSDFFLERAKIGIFYVIFYFCLAVFWLTFLWLFSLTLDPRIPKYKLDDSLIGTNPGELLSLWTPHCECSRLQHPNQYHQQYTTTEGFRSCIVEMMFHAKYQVHNLIQFCLKMSNGQLFKLL